MADKKILEDELLSDEELANVAGGNYFQIADDSKFLNSLNGSCNRRSEEFFILGSMYLSKQPFIDSVKRAWAAVGVEADLNISGYRPNSYYINGQSVSQEEARAHAMEVVGKHMNESDWNW